LQVVEAEAEHWWAPVIILFHLMFFNFFFEALQVEETETEHWWAPVIFLFHFF
jgi:hypothetical protein